MRFFSNLKIKTKIAIGFALVLALLVAVAGAAWQGLDDGSHNLADVSRFASNSATAAAMDTDASDLLVAVQDFLRDGSAESATEFEALQGALTRRTQELLPRLTVAENIRLVTELQDLLPKADAGFHEIREFRETRNRLVEDIINTAGAEAREAITDLIGSLFARAEFRTAAMAGQVQQQLLLARLRTEQYLATNKQELVESARTAIAGFELAAANLRPALTMAADQALLSAATASMESYEQAFEEVATLIPERNAAIAALRSVLATEIDQRTTAVAANAAAARTKVETEAAQASGFALTLALAVSGIAIALGALIAFVIAMGITRPVRNMTEAMGKLAAGDKTIAIVGAERKDEIGAMAQAVQVFKDNAIAMDRLQAEQKEAEARSEAEKKAAMAKLAEDFEASVGGIVNMLSSAATEMQSTAESMSATAEETSRQSSVVAAASEQASTNVQTVASAAEELSSSISEIGRQVSQSSSIAGKAVSEAERTNVLVQGLVEAGQKIGAVTSLINEIASQTNLLALNATIEAARAGEAGKGFAVVASEVKSLANQTAKATEEIGAQIAAMQGATGDTVSAIGSIGQTIGQINEIATTIAAAVEEQGAATQEIARNVQQAATGTQEVSGNITGVTQAASQTGAAASQVLGAAGELSQQAEHLRSQVDTFLAAVRAA